MVDRTGATLLSTAFLFACGPSSDEGNIFTADGAGLTDDEIDGSGSDSGSSSDSASDSTSDASSSEGGIKLDTLPADTAADGPIDENCDFVDILFVIDNSVSMGGYQTALGLAFPQFATTLAEVLPPGTNVHVGVTSTEMGYASSGSTSINNGMCTFTGDNNQPNSAFYITPDQQNTGKNGAQGRLFDPGGGQVYFDFDVDGGQPEIDALANWFADAAAIGTGGSNIEMSAAPAGWAFDSANAATNSGFVRDEGAVLLLFFMTDEPDQTPAIIDNMPGGQAMLAKIAAAKTGCGGLECVLGGGFLLESACNAMGNLPLDDLLAGMSEPPVSPSSTNQGVSACSGAGGGVACQILRL